MGIENKGLKTSEESIDAREGTETLSLDHLLNLARNRDSAVFDHIDNLDSDEVTSIIDEYFKSAIEYSGEQGGLNDPAIKIVNNFNNSLNKFDVSYHGYIAQKMIESGEYGIRIYLEHRRLFQADHDALIRQIFISDNLDVLKRYYPYVPPDCRSDVIDCLIEKKGFSVNEKKVQTPTWDILVKELTDENGDIWFTLNIIFVDKNGKEIDTGALLPENWMFVEVPSFVLGDLCRHETKTIWYKELSEFSLLNLLHEIGHAYDDSCDPSNPDYHREEEGKQAKAERDAWAWALKKVKDLKRQGVEFPESFEYMKNVAYTNLRSYDKGMDTDLFTKGKEFEEIEEIKDLLDRGDN